LHYYNETIPYLHWFTLTVKILSLANRIKKSLFKYKQFPEATSKVPAYYDDKKRDTLFLPL